MRIALISRRFDPAGGGTERDFIITARILAGAGHELTLYAGEVRAPSQDFRVCRLSAPPLGRALRLLWFANSAARVARRDGADLVVSFARILEADILRSGGGAHSSYLRAARQWRGRAGALAMRLSPYHRAQMAIERRGFGSPRLKKAIAVSELVRADLIESFALDPAKVVTLYNGVDLERFRAPGDAAARAVMRSELGIPKGARAIVFVGNGFARKGLPFMIEAWPALDGAPWLIVAGADRAMGAYRRRANRLGVGSRIIFAGPHSRVERLFAAADGLALPSLFEPFGNVVMEAMAAGLPVLCGAACGAAETLPAPMREFIVRDPANLDELASRLNALLRAGGELCHVARATAEKFTWERYGAQLLALIDSL